MEKSLSHFPSHQVFKHRESPAEPARSSAGGCSPDHSVFHPVQICRGSTPAHHQAVNEDVNKEHRSQLAKLSWAPRTLKTTAKSRSQREDCRSLGPRNKTHTFSSKSILGPAMQTDFKAEKSHPQHTSSHSSATRSGGSA